MICGEILWWTHKMVWSSSHSGRPILAETVIRSLWNSHHICLQLRNSMIWAPLIIMPGSHLLRKMSKGVGMNDSPSFGPVCCLYRPFEVFLLCHCPRYSFTFSFVLCFSPYKIWNIVFLFLLFTFGITNWSIYFLMEREICVNVILCEIIYFSVLLERHICAIMDLWWPLSFQECQYSLYLRDEPSNLKPWMEFIDNLIITSFNIWIISSRIV